MTLIDYPGHLWAVLALLLCAGWIAWSFATNALARLGWRRWGLAALAWLPVVLGLWLLANPGRLDKQAQQRPCTVLALFDTSESMSVTQDQEQIQATRLDLAMERFRAAFRPGQPSSPKFQYYGFDRGCVSAGDLTQLPRWGKRSNLVAAWSQISPWLARPTQDDPGDISGIVIFTDGQVEQQDVALVHASEYGTGRLSQPVCNPVTTCGAVLGHPPDRVLPHEPCRAHPGGSLVHTISACCIHLYRPDRLAPRRPSRRPGRPRRVRILRAVGRVRLRAPDRQPRVDIGGDRLR